MSDEKRGRGRGVAESDEIELDAEAADDIEAAMREALEAVERADGGNGPTGGGEEAVAAPEPGAADEADDQQIAHLLQEIQELRDRSVRTFADFENYRKRVERERRDERRYAAFEVVREFLPVVDNLERALASEGPAEELKRGVELIRRQLEDLLRGFGVRRVPAAGERFDPSTHEAVSRLEDPSVEAPTVREELLAGYTMHDRLLRPATVRVAMPPEAGRDAEPAEAEPRPE